MEPREYDLMYAIEETYWWYVAKREIVVRIIRHWIKPRGPLEILDIGCGTGGNLLALRRFGPATGCDISAEAVAYAKGRGLDDIVHQPDPQRLPFPDGRFDLVTALEVLEHAGDDVGLLREIGRVLKPGGVALLSVPAFPALWSVHDEAAHHRRRYRKAGLLGAIREAGLTTVRVTYLDGFLLPLIVPVRWVRDRIVRGKAVTTDFNLILPRWLNAVFRAVFRSEWVILRFGSLPVGLSLCCLVRKP
ncbi:MAG: class I SAM-dependent methyltransferase [Candidatus Coatesbacteria bacterium]